MLSLEAHGQLPPKELFIVELLDSARGFLNGTHLDESTAFRLARLLVNIHTSTENLEPKISNELHELIFVGLVVDVAEVQDVARRIL